MTTRQTILRQTILRTALLATVFLAPAVGVLAQGSGSSGSAGDASTKANPRPRPSKAATAALKNAKAILAKAKGQRGAARKAILAQAAAAYTKVMADFASEPVGAAPASFAAAEIWRKQSELTKAKGFYQKAIELDRGRYEERCLLQLAHIARRQKNPTGAIEIYKKVAVLKPKSARAHESRVWIGRCLAMSGQHDEAITALRAAVDLAGTKRQRIGVCNRLAGLLVKRGQLDAAEQVIQRAAEAAKPAPGAKGKNAERTARSLQKAFDQMSARRALQRARDKANKAHKDAASLEKKKSGA